MVVVGGGRRVVSSRTERDGALRDDHYDKQVKGLTGNGIMFIYINGHLKCTLRLLPEVRCVHTVRHPKVSCSHIVHNIIPRNSVECR